MIDCKSEFFRPNGPRNNERGIVERWRILNTLVLAGQTGRLGLLGSRGGAFYEPYILRELREIRVHIESSCPRPLGMVLPV